MARGCLFGGKAVDLKSPLVAGDAVLREALGNVILGKPEGHHLGADEDEREAFAMSGIGG